MVIVDQDKMSIVNFDNVASVFVEDSNVAVVLIDTHIKTRHIFRLGMYESEERAKAVLGKLINAIGLNMYMYQMPKK